MSPNFAFILTHTVRRFVRRGRKSSYPKFPLRRVRLGVEQLEDRNAPGSLMSGLGGAMIGQSMPIEAIARVADVVGPEAFASPPPEAESSSGWQSAITAPTTPSETDNSLDQPIATDQPVTFFDNYNSARPEQPSENFDSQIANLPDLNAYHTVYSNDNSWTFALGSPSGGGGGAGSDSSSTPNAGRSNQQIGDGSAASDNSNTSQPISPTSSAPATNSTPSAFNSDMLKSLLAALSANTNAPAVDPPSSLTIASPTPTSTISISTPGSSSVTGSTVDDTAQPPIAFAQVGSGSNYTARTPDYAIALQPTGVTFTLGSGDAVHLNMIGANPNASSRSGFLAGQISYSNVWPGISVSYYGNARNQFEFDFTVAPNADASQIQMQITGAASLDINPNGSLAVQMNNGGNLIEQAPLVYQQAPGSTTRQAISASYELLGNNRVGFTLGDFNHTLPLIIDPSVTTVPGTQTTSSNNVLTFSSAASNAISIADSNPSSTPITVSLSVAHGTLTLAQTAKLTISTGTGAYDSAVTFTGTVADINAALNGLTYSPHATFSGDDPLSINVTDPDSSASASVAIAVNPAPSIDVPDDQQTNPNTALPISGITVADSGPADTLLTVSLSVASGTLTLSGTTNLTFATGTGTGDLSMSFTGLAADINTALNGLTYTPNTDYHGDETLNISVDDPGTIASHQNTASAMVAINVNYPPPNLTVPNDMTANAGTSPTLTATATSLAGIASVVWSFSYNGEDYVVDSTMTTLSAAHLFATYGEYDVTVTVTANDGQVSEDGFHVSVTEVTPAEPAVSVSGSGLEGSTYTFTIRTVDPDTLDTVSIYADWNGTGQFEEVDPSLYTVNEDGTISFDHLYDDANSTSVTVLGVTTQVQLPSYTAVIRVEDDGGQNTDYPVTVAVADVKPTFTLAAGSTYPDTDLQGNPLYVMSPGENVEFRNVVDPSSTDTESGLTYHWIVNGGTEQLTTLPELALADETYGKITVIKGWVTDKDNVPTDIQTIRVHFMPTGTYVYWLRGGLFGSMLPSNIKTPPEYDPYKDNFPNPDIVAPLSDNLASPVSVTIQLDDASLNINNWGPSFSLEYVFAVNVYDVETTSIGGSHHDLLPDQSFSQTGGSNTLVLPSYPADRQIDVYGYVNVHYFGESPLQLNHHWVQFNTPRTQPTSDWLASLSKLLDGIPNAVSQLQDLVTQYGDRAAAIVTAIATNPVGFMNTLLSGVAGAASNYIAGLANPENLKQIALKWLTGGTNIPMPDLRNPASVTSALLQYSNLTWDHVKSVLAQSLGENNIAAATTVANWLNGYIGTNPDGSDNPDKLVQFIDDMSASFDGLTSSSLQNDLLNSIQEKLKSTLLVAAGNLASKFIPGAGVVRSVYQGLSWIFSNYQSFQPLLEKLLTALDALAQGDETLFQQRLGTLFNDSTPLLLDFGASQLGMSGLSDKIRAAVQFVPNKVDAALLAAVTKVAKPLLPSGAGNLYDGLLGPVVPFSYNQINYQLWVAKEGNTAKVKVSKVGTGKLLAVLTAASFDNSVTPSAQADISNLISKSQSLAQASVAPKKPALPAPSQLATMRDLGTQVTLAQNQVVKDIQANACKALNAGCFTGESQLWTPNGFRAIKDILEGEWVFSRDEFDPNGAIVAKQVEAKFERTGRIFHMHMQGGRLIRTTQEHPFFTQERGWTEAGALIAGDMVRTDCDWQIVEEVFDTGEYETVYNLRVSDFHTYFVGGEDWGFSVWAHNACFDVGPYASLPSNADFPRHHVPQVAVGKYRWGADYDPNEAPAIVLPLWMHLQIDHLSTLEFERNHDASVVSHIRYQLKELLDFNVPKSKVLELKRLVAAVLDVNIGPLPS